MGKAQGCQGDCDGLDTDCCIAHGITIVTGAASWESWAMAVGIDVGFVALELSQLSINDKVRKQASRFARPAILGTLAGSAAMNAFAFAAQTINPWMMAAAMTLDIAIPALIYALTLVGAALWIDVHGRACMTVFNIETLNAVGARLFGHADSIPNVAAKWSWISVWRPGSAPTSRRCGFALWRLPRRR
jgi:hypothetical protein